MNQDNKEFKYAYSASHHEEVERIRKKYMTFEEDKMAQLRKLDQSVSKPGMIVSLVLGVVGTMAFGIGLCCTLVWADDWFVQGILIGITGMIMMIFAYPAYAYITKKRREKLAPEIIRLTDELLK